MRSGCLYVLAAAASLGLATSVSAAQLTVGSGASFDLGTGSLDLGCGDLVVAGAFDAANGSIGQTDDVTIPVGGTLEGGASTIEVAGDWSNSGTFLAQTSAVLFKDGCSSTSSTVSGSNTFNDLSLTTAMGKQIFFASGVTQTVSGMTTLAGAPGNLLVIRSTVDGSEAFFDLSQEAVATYVDVKDNHAVGSPIGLGEGSVSSGNSSGWLQTVLAPGLTLLGLLVLGVSLYATGRRWMRGSAAVHG